MGILPAHRSEGERLATTTNIPKAITFITIIGHLFIRSFFFFNSYRSLHDNKIGTSLPLSVKINHLSRYEKFLFFSLTPGYGIPISMAMRTSDGEVGFSLNAEFNDARSENFPACLSARTHDYSIHKYTGTSFGIHPPLPLHLTFHL